MSPRTPNAKGLMASAQSTPHGKWRPGANAFLQAVTLNQASHGVTTQDTDQERIVVESDRADQCRHRPCRGSFSRRRVVFIGCSCAGNEGSPDIWVRHTARDSRQIGCVAGLKTGAIPKEERILPSLGPMKRWVLMSTVRVFPKKFSPPRVSF